MLDVVRECVNNVVSGCFVPLEHFKWPFSESCLNQNLLSGDVCLLSLLSAWTLHELSAPAMYLTCYFTNKHCPPVAHRHYHVLQQSNKKKKRQHPKFTLPSNSHTVQTVWNAFSGRAREEKKQDDAYCLDCLISLVLGVFPACSLTCSSFWSRLVHQGRHRRPFSLSWTRNDLVSHSIPTHQHNIHYNRIPVSSRFQLGNFIFFI